MGQILIIQDEGKLGSLLDGSHSIVNAAGIDELRALLSGQRFDTAVVVGQQSAEAVLSLLHEADAELAVIVAVDPAVAVGNDSNWETLATPIQSSTLRAAIRRAMRCTNLARQNAALRRQLDANGGSENSGAHSGDGVNPGHLTWITSLPPRLDLRELLSRVEKGVIQRTLEATRGAQAEAARRLNLSRSDLSYKLAKYELRKSNARPD